MDLLLPFFYLIMLPAIRDKLLMLAQHEKCPKVPIQLGGTTKMVLKCEQRLSWLITHLKTFTLWTTIQQCLDGSKGWKLLSVNGDFGHKKDWMRNVRGSSARQGRLIAVVVGCYSHSLTSRTRSLTWKSSSPPGVTSVISIPNTTASSTSLSSTGELQSWSTGPARRRRTWRKWKRMSRTHLTTFPLSRFNGELIVSTPIVNDLKLTPYQSHKITWRGSSAHMTKVWAVRRQSGQTGNIMVTEHCLQKWLQS